jgi:hypothetical protein
VAGGWLGAMRRGQQWRRPTRCEEELPVGAVRSTAHEGWPAGGAGAVVPHVGRGWTVVEHRGASRGLAGGERRVKTQPSLGRAGNDDARSVIPLLRALSCRLIPRVWTLGESPVSVLFETLTDDGGSVFVASLLGDVV